MLNTVEFKKSRDSHEKVMRSDEKVIRKSTSLLQFEYFANMSVHLVLILDGWCQSLRWAPFIWKDSGFSLFQEMTHQTGRNSASCQLALCGLTTFMKS